MTRRTLGLITCNNKVTSPFFSFYHSTLLANWRASGASETLSPDPFPSPVSTKKLKIGDIYLFIYLDVRMSFCTLTLAYFCVCSVFDPVPSFTKQNPPVM